MLQRICFAIAKYSVVTLFVSGSVFAQQNALYYLELNEIGATPAEIILSPDYQTLIEFEGLSVQSASSGRGDQITVESHENTIRLRANQESVNTDLTVMVGGKTALFILRSDPAANSPRRYVVRNSPPPTLLSLSHETIQGDGTLNALSVGTRDLPPGVKLDLSATRAGNGEIAIRYTLNNDGQNPIVNDTYRLHILNEDLALHYTLSRVPPAGSVNVLQPGQSEYGTIVVPDPPNGNLSFLWILVERGPGGHYSVARDIVALINTGQQLAPRTDTTQAMTADMASQEITPTPATQVAEQQAMGQEKDEPTPRASAPTMPASKTAQPGNNLVWTGSFVSGAQGVMGVAQGSYCFDVFKKGQEPWGVRLDQNQLVLEPGHTYTLSFDAYADTPQQVMTKIHATETPQTAFSEQVSALQNQPQTFTVSFTTPEAAESKSEMTLDSTLTFLAGDDAAAAPFHLCLDNIALQETTMANN
jgi:Carbohydrate binding domain